MRRIFISGPITQGDLLHNIQQARESYLALIKAGYAPLCPHLSVFCGDYHSDAGVVFAKADKLPRGTTHRQWVDICLAWIDVSDAVLRLPGDSEGAYEEVVYAMQMERDVPVYYSLEDLLRGVKP